MDWWMVKLCLGQPYSLSLSRLLPFKIMVHDVIFMPPRSKIGGGGILFLSCLSFCNSVIL